MLIFATLVETIGICGREELFLVFVFVPNSSVLIFLVWTGDNPVYTSLTGNIFFMLAHGHGNVGYFANRFLTVPYFYRSVTATHVITVYCTQKRPKNVRNHKRDWKLTIFFSFYEQLFERTRRALKTRDP